MKKLLTKYLLGENLDAKDRRNLPFIIYEQEITFNDAVKILNVLDFNRTSHLRRVVSVYLLNYDNTPKTKLLRERLEVVREVDSVSLKKIFAARENLFTENHIAIDSMWRYREKFWREYLPHISSTWIFFLQ